jgi:hypothetical protein
MTARVEDCTIHLDDAEYDFKEDQALQAIFSDPVRLLNEAGKEIQGEVRASASLKIGRIIEFRGEKYIIKENTVGKGASGIPPPVRPLYFLNCPDHPLRRKVLNVLDRHSFFCVLTSITELESM